MLSLTCTLPAMGKALAELACGVALIFGIAGIAHCNDGCVPSQGPTDLERSYTAELVACSSNASTKADARACRDDVNRRYGLCPRDAWPRITPCDD